MSTRTDTLQQMQEVVDIYNFRKVDQDSRPAIECHMPARFHNKDEQVRVIIQPDMRGAQTPRCWCPGIGELERAVNSELFDLKYRKEWDSATSTLVKLVEAIREGLYKKDLYTQQSNPAWNFGASYFNSRNNAPWSMPGQSNTAVYEGDLHGEWPVSVVPAPQGGTSNMAASMPSAPSKTLVSPAHPHAMLPRSKTEYIHHPGDRSARTTFSERSSSLPTPMSHTGPLLGRTAGLSIERNGSTEALSRFLPTENGLHSPEQTQFLVEAPAPPHVGQTEVLPSKSSALNGIFDRLSSHSGNSELHHKIKQLENDLEAQTAKVDDKTRQLADKTHQLDDKTRQLDDKTRQLDDKTRQLDDKTRQLRKAQEEIRNLPEELDSERGRFNLQQARSEERIRERERQLNNAVSSRQQMMQRHEMEMENQLQLHREQCRRLALDNENLHQQVARGVSMGSIPGNCGGDDDKEKKLHVLQTYLEQERMRSREFETQLQISKAENKDLAQQLYEQKAVIESLTTEVKQMERLYGGLPDNHEVSLTSGDFEQSFIERTGSLSLTDRLPLHGGDMASVPVLSDNERLRMYQVHAQRASQDRQEVYILFTTKVADYDVVKMIDHGCEGAVYLVRCKRPRLPDPGKLYALKVMFNIFQLGSMTQVRKQYQTEYDILAALPPHRNIVRLFAFFFDRMGTHLPDLPAEVRERARSMSLFLVMEYHPHTLADVCLEARMHQQLTFELLVNWSYQLAEAALFLTHHNVVHRDMKLNNILVSRDGILKVCDFGFAAQLESEELTVRRFPNMPSGGNPSHLAPEVLLASTGQAPVDTISYAKQSVWELGVLIHEIVTAKSPFRDLDQMGYCVADIPDLPLDSLPSARGKDTSSGRRELHRLVKQMLEFEPDLRPTIVQVHAALTSLNTRFSIPSAALMSTQPKSLPAHLAR